MGQRPVDFESGASKASHSKQSRQRKLAGIALVWHSFMTFASTKNYGKRDISQNILGLGFTNDVQSDIFMTRILSRVNGQRRGKPRLRQKTNKVIAHFWQYQKPAISQHLPVRRSQYSHVPNRFLEPEDTGSCSLCEATHHRRPCKAARVNAEKRQR